MLWRQRIYSLICVGLIMITEKGLNVYTLHCKSDLECPKGQYCYMENTCASFTNCTVMFNREEGSAPARDAHQCGNCIRGYYEEEYTHERPDKCKRETELKNNIKPSSLKIILSVVGGVVTVTFVIILCCFYLKKKFKLNFFNGRSTSENKHVDNKKLEDQCAINLENREMLLPVPTAPLDESSTYCEDKSKYNLPDVRIKKELDCIEFQCARVSVPPFYVNHANYGTNDIYHSVDDTDASHQQVVSIPNNNNVMSSTHSTMAISTGGSEASTENEDNTNNAQQDNSTSFKKKIVVNQTNYIKLSL